jgi:pyrimidine-nucleoside phosphorylase
MVRAYDVIKRKRDGRRLTAAEIAGFLDGYLDGEIPDYQMSALLMAVWFRGLDSDELAVWAERMLHSGTVLDLSDIPGRKVDKHSTGGVGDKISLPLAPLVASVGVKVPMISGRGLGHTGGTLDKLESIPGFSVNLSARRFRELVREIGVCMIGQTADIAPLDRRLYALRDVTACVDSIPLISSSIMSKKLAEGIDALVLDVKVGSGAFMKTEADARRLAETMVGIGRTMGKKVVAVLTDMSQPLGEAVGNAVEVAESAAVLKGDGPADILELTLVLGTHMVRLADRAPDAATARAMLVEAIRDGRAMAKFRELAAAQGGDAAALDDWSRLPGARERVPVPAGRAGFVRAIDTELVGRAAMALGAGRARVDSPIDPGVGLLVHAKVGARVDAETPIVTLLVNDPAGVPEARALLAEAYDIGPDPVAPPPLVIGVVE